VTTFLENQKIQYAVIGGIANQIWGQARFTYDIDIKVLVPDSDYKRLRMTLTKAFSESGRPDLPTNPLIVSVKVGEIIVDFLLSTPGYEEQLVKRAIHYKFEDLSLWICTAEDLIIQKAVAGRAKDWQDIEGIVIEQKTKLNQNYLEDWLSQFAEVLDSPDIFNHYRTIWQLVKTSK
jgi:predicted nucleotidyltransferase